jgi:antitoxin component YwqK of YwqJK toxin-antitoxin module
MLRVVSIFFIFISFGFTAEKVYVKNYYQSGKMKSEGWSIENKKVDYWFYYFENGNVKQEGHYLNDKKTKWWIFYNSNKEIIKKCEFENDIMEGLCIVYKDGDIIGAEKYAKGKKIKYWNSVSEFKKDNDFSMLND